MNLLMRLLLAAILGVALVGCDRFLQQLPADGSTPDASQTAPADAGPSDAPPMPTPEASPAEPSTRPDEPGFEPTPEIPPPIY